MQHRTIAAGALVAMTVIGYAEAADIGAGKAIAEGVCAACHGVNGVSVAPAIPNLAGQRPLYIGKQLSAYREGSRKHRIMGALAGQLDKAAAADVAAYYGSLPGAPVGAANSKPPARFIAKRVKLPADLSGFRHYMTFNHQGRKELRKVYANGAALAAAKAGRELPDGAVIVVEAFKTRPGADGKPVAGADGLWLAGARAGFTAMERQAGWGDDFHPAIRNGNWHYAAFAADRSPRPNLSQASCLACHKPLAGDSYLFSLKELKAAAAK
jgi:cytochrome c553